MMKVDELEERRLSMKLIAAKVTYLNENLDVVSEIKFGYESIAQISIDGTEMSTVFVVPTERSKPIEDRSTLTSEIYCMPIAYEKYEILPNMDGYEFYPPKRMKNIATYSMYDVKTDYVIDIKTRG